GSVLLVGHLQPGGLVGAAALVLGAEMLLHTGQDQQAHQCGGEAAVVKLLSKASHFLSLPLEGKVPSLSRRMRWKKIEISSFSIHNAFGYTSSASQARHLPLKGRR
ncbi:MAG: hypothetical protein IIV27_05035, partial [Clostridia bacterium]|nr:hypothetical protein [Clostridia bacterium]